jgi:hypothetical protein
MRVAYRESVADSCQKEMEFEKVIGGAHMYCKLHLQIESTIDEFDVADFHRQKIEGEGMDINTSSLGENSVIFDFEDLEPVVERIKLEGDEYEKSRKR